MPKNLLVQSYTQLQYANLFKISWRHILQNVTSNAILSKRCGVLCIRWADIVDRLITQRKKMRKLSVLELVK